MVVKCFEMFANIPSMVLEVCPLFLPGSLHPYFLNWFLHFFFVIDINFYGKVKNSLKIPRGVICLGEFDYE